MFFKNLRVYTMAPETDFSKLEDQLGENEFIECPTMSESSSGFIPPLGSDGAMLTHTIQKYTMVCLKTQSKIIPASAVNEEVERIVFKIKEEESRNVSRVERQDIKEDVVGKMLPRALTKSRLTFAYIDLERNRLFINASSLSEAENLLSSLRSVMGSLPVTPLDVNADVCKVMTGWLNTGLYPHHITDGDECELRSWADPSATLRVKNFYLRDDDIKAHIANGMDAKKIGVNYNNNCTFVIDEDLSIKKIKFTDLFIDNSYVETEDFMAEFNIMASEFTDIINVLIDGFGGEAGHAS